ncbi:MAG TPA: tetratricopeptide repeat protein [Vicinamibacterales bacterium]|nr:tetratricopeptide repeat protein [Vicinamibacterales bacterium]
MCCVLLYAAAGPAQPAAPPAAAAEARKALEQAAAHFDKQENEAALAAYDRAIALDRSNPEAFIGRGRTLARLRRYEEAIAAYSEVLRLAPNHAMALRYRGHNAINLRRLDAALADLERAAALEQNDFGIYYHLGLAYYLHGRWADAAQAYEGCTRTARTDDDRVACLAWRYPSLRRAGRAEEAARLLEQVTPDLKVEESAVYLDRLLLFKGQRTEEEAARRMAPPAGGAPAGDAAIQRATAGYSLGLWHLLEGRPERARAYFEQAAAAGAPWAFGAIAAEIELRRMRQ